MPVTYDPRSHRYRDTVTGRWVSWKDVTIDLYGSLDTYKWEADSLGRSLRIDLIDLETFETEMRRMIKEVQATSYALGKGGFHNLSPADWSRIESMVADEYAYLRRFVQQIESGAQPLDGRLDRRARMYIEMGGKTHHIAMRESMIILGFDVEANILDPFADHCMPKERPGCKEETARSWVSIGELSLIGDRQCRSGCRCRVIYKNSNTGEVRR